MKNILVFDGRRLEIDPEESASVQFMKYQGYGMIHVSVFVKAPNYLSYLEGLTIGDSYPVKVVDDDSGAELKTQTAKLTGIQLMYLSDSVQIDLDLVVGTPPEA